MIAPVTYAKALETSDWEKMHIVYPDGSEEAYVIEANSAEGWLIRYKRDADGKLCSIGDEFVTERVERPFTIEVRP